MGVIKIMYDGLDKQVSSMGQQIQSYESLNTRANNLKQQIASSWEGKAAAAYAEKLDEYIREAKKMTSILEAFRGYANNSSARFKQLDHNCAMKIRNSF